MRHAEFMSAFEAAAGPLAEASGALVASLEAHFRAASDPPIKIHSIRARIKERASLTQKLARPDKTYRHLWELTDLLGIRIITFFEDEVDRIGRLIEGHLPIDFAHSVDKRRGHEESRFGYRSLHYICHLPEIAGLQRHGEGPAPRYEIQVRTLLEHAWAEIEHDLGYKARDTMPAPVRRRLHRLAGLLELADQEFAAIRRELTAYAEDLPARIAAAEPVPLDRLSLEGLLALPECRALDAELAARLDKPLGQTPFFPDYLLRMLGLAGLTSVEEVRAGLRQHGRTIAAMALPYFEFAGACWGLSTDAMEDVLRGYALFFLAHAHVLGAESTHLKVNAVMRLGRFYTDLDYPDAPREAQRVASLLLNAFQRHGALLAEHG